MPCIVFEEPNAVNPPTLPTFARVQAQHPEPLPNATQEQTGGCCRGSAQARLALLEASCQGASEDFVPPAAQRGSVRRSEVPSWRISRL